MSDVEITMASQSGWEAIAEFVTLHPYGHIEHTWQGAQLLVASSGGRWQAGVCVARKGGEIVGVMPCAIARVRGIPITACRSAGGPLVRSEFASELAPKMLQWLVDWAESKRCCRVELRLRLPETFDGKPANGAGSMLEAIQSAGLTRLPPPHFGTYWVCLGDDEEILASFSKKCRRDVRKGLREGVVVDCRASAEALWQFREMYVAMCERKSLSANSERFFREGVAPCLESGVAGIFVSTYNDQPCNMALVSLTGMPRYWLGATAPAAMKWGTPPTGQVLHYEIMRHLRSLGRRIYDLGGSPGPEPEPGHPNYGVWKFKHDFRGRWVDYLDRFELVLSPALDLLMRAAYRMVRLL